MRYVLVPEEATPEMIEAGMNAAAPWLDLGRGIEAQREKYRRRWRAMVAASPTVYGRARDEENGKVLGDGVAERFDPP